MHDSRRPIGILPFERIAIFIDGWNFKCATYDGLQFRVDFAKLLRYFSQKAILLRAYYYTGEWTEDSIDWYVKLRGFSNPEEKKKEILSQKSSEESFWRFLNRNGYQVVKKPIRVVRDRSGEILTKADLDLELAIDMLTLAEKCEKQILISGDGDFIPLVKAVGLRGVRVAVVSTLHPDARKNAHYAANEDLADAADEFHDLADIRKYIEREEERGR